MKGFTGIAAVTAVSATAAVLLVNFLGNYPESPTRAETAEKLILIMVNSAMMTMLIHLI